MAFARMNWPLPRSLIFRVGIAMAGITVLALASMLGSVIIAETAKGDAAAINLAGSLRMRAYQLASLIAQPASPAVDERVRMKLVEFQSQLTDPRITHLLPDDAERPLREVYDRVHAQWTEAMRPALLAYGVDPELARGQFLTRVDEFVTDIDRLVWLIQQQAEARVTLLRLIQGLALFLTVGLVFFTMYKLLTDVMPPLRELLQVVNRARAGDFSARAAYAGRDELGLLAHTFNLMAEDLSRMYADLERRVEDKTVRLTRSNRALRLLYQAARGPRGEDHGTLLAQVEQVTGLPAVTLCLTTENADRAYRRVGGEARPGFCRAPDCAPCLRPGALADRPAISIPVQESERRFGTLLVGTRAGEPLEGWQRELLEAVAGHIATAISLARQREQQHRIALMEERAVIARELHDSLAQSLSYLKIQVSRLQKLLEREGVPAGADEVIAELKQGLASAYRQLRELLTTFRLRMDEPGLEPALRNAVAEFAQRGGLDIALDYGLGHCPLTPNEELHVLQVVREALSNVVHHAQARAAEVRLAMEADGAALIEILDDGVGLPEQWQRQHHYGVAIMQERAQTLAGRLDLRRRDTGGTEVRLRFLPEATRSAHAPDLEPATP